ncbi:hypothetical protein ANN_20336 [Periplaneta americana]|uniref:Chromo domain-containing protein n=1 Tax=Periplaneta americana TaxID=6978 RepID=A0ABQ8SD06_PERAM|nr:hypothetical protein ANN_20336 [Periplaneta americana]
MLVALHVVILCICDFTYRSMGLLASNISVGIGDKLKVYYGPTHESKVTYEAKVLDIEEDGNERVYLVHYTGWNTRYDEWIKRGRIADNLSWTPSRAKRLRHQQAQAQLKLLEKKLLNLVWGSVEDHRCVDARLTYQMLVSRPPRSTTPSSVTSTSSRNKSPGASASTSRTAPSSRVTRNGGDPSQAIGPDFMRRTRRMSGHTDISMASETESEEYESEVEVEIEPTQTRSRTEKRSLLTEKEEVVKDEQPPKDDVKKLDRPFRRKAGKRKEEDEEEDKESPREDDSIELPPEATPPPSEAPQSTEKRRSKRTKKTPGTPTIEKKQEEEPKMDTLVKQEAGTESEEEQPKGRDFDLNQIRSELKGIEKAVKLPLDVVHRPEEKCSQLILDDKTGIIDIHCKLEEKEEVQAKVAEKVEDTSTEDVYEFKEPEPFEFEVRSKRDTLLSEDRSGKLTRRPRIFDDVVEPKIEKSPRKKLIRSAISNKADGKDETTFEGEVKKRFRRSVAKKAETPAVEPKRKEITPAEEVQLSPSKPVQVVEPVTPPQKSRPLSACEEAFDKLCESPSFHVAAKPCEERTPSPATLEPLSLFSEGPDDEGEDDSEDRLVISETDETETETEEPLFTYPQRHHEELFPTLVTSEPAAPTPEQPSVIDRLVVPPKPSPEPPQLLPIGADIFTNFGASPDITGKNEGEGSEESEKISEQSPGVQMSDDMMKLLLKGGDDDEYEEDPINAAIQRVIEQSMTDEESNDMDIFGSKRSVCSIENIQEEAIVTPKQEPRKDVLPKETKRKSGSRSKEFVEDSDSDSDSSDEEERLVIAKVDDEDDNMSCSSSQSSLKLHVSESSDFEMKLRLSDRDEDSKTEGEDSEGKLEKISDSAKETSPCVPEVEKDIEDTAKGDMVVEKETAFSVEEAECTEPAKSESDNTTATTTTTTATTVTTITTQDIELADLPSTSTSTLVAEVTPAARNDPVTLPKPDDTLEEEDIEEAVPVLEPCIDDKPEESHEGEKCEEETESNLRSLLCEETIPGSPAPAGDSLQVIEACHEEAIDSKTTVLEMPFASAPGSNCTPSSSGTTKTSTAPIFASPPVIEPPATTVDLSTPIQVQTMAASTLPSASPPPPPSSQVQVQVQPLPLSLPLPLPAPSLSQVLVLDPACKVQVQVQVCLKGTLMRQPL